MKNNVYIFVLFILSVTILTYYFKPVHPEKHFYVVNKQFPQIPLEEESYVYQYENDRVIVGKLKNNENYFRCFAKNRWHFIWVK